MNTTYQHSVIKHTILITMTANTIDDANDNVNANVSDDNITIRLVCGSYENAIYGLETILPKQYILDNNNNVDDDNTDNNQQTNDNNNNNLDNNNNISDADDNLDDLDDDNNVDNGTTSDFTSLFSLQPHLGSIKTVVCDPYGQYMCTGSSDEIIKVYDLNKMIEYGSLYKHNNVVNNIEFYTIQDTNELYMLSTDTNGNIAIWNTKQWNCIEFNNINVQNNNDYITSLTIHKSGKFMLYITHKGHQCIYNLLTFQIVYSNKLDSIASHIQYNNDSTYYALIVNNTNIGIYNTHNELIQVYTDIDSKIISLLWLNNNKLIVGLESGYIHINDINTDNNNNNTKPIVNEQIHDSRVRSMSICYNDTVHNITLFTTCSTDGSISIWQYNNDHNTLQPISATYIQSRLLCIHNIPPYTMPPRFKVIEPKKNTTTIKLNDNNNKQNNTTVDTSNTSKHSKSQQKVLNRLKDQHLAKLQKRQEKQKHKQKNQDYSDIANDNAIQQSQQQQRTPRSTKQVQFTDNHDDIKSQSATKSHGSILKKHKYQAMLDKFNDDSDDDMPVLAQTNKSITTDNVINFIDDTNVEKKKKKKKHRYQHQ